MKDTRKNLKVSENTKERLDAKRKEYATPSGKMESMDDIIHRAINALEKFEIEVKNIETR